MPTTENSNFIRSQKKKEKKLSLRFGTQMEKSQAECIKEHICRQGNATHLVILQKQNRRSLRGSPFFVPFYPAKSSAVCTGILGSPVSSCNTPPTNAITTCIASQSNMWLDFRTRFQ